MKGACSILIVLLFLLAGIAGKGTCGMPKGAPLHLRYASCFHVEYLGNGQKRVIDGAGRSLLLVPWGQKVGVIPKGDTVIRIPVKRVVTRWTTIPPLLGVLGVMDSIVGVTTRKEWWHIKEIRRRIEQGSIKCLGGSTTIDYEGLRALSPDVFFAGQWEDTCKLNELGLPFAVVTEYLENDPLGRLEWIKFFAAFYNREREAAKFFDNVCRNVSRLSERVKGVKEWPKVLWGTINAQEMVYVPRTGSYVARMIAMSGGNYVFRQLSGTLSASISLEELYAKGKDSDIFIYSGSLPEYGIKTIQGLVTRYPILSDLKPIKEGKVWCFQPWYWESIEKTDEIIEDLAAIFHPKLFPGHKPRYFLRLLRK